MKHRCASTSFSIKVLRKGAPFTVFLFVSASPCCDDPSGDIAGVRQPGIC